MEHMRLNVQHLGDSELRRRYHLNVNDTGTMTADQECARMYWIQEYGAELQRRGIDPDTVARSI